MKYKKKVNPKIHFSNERTWLGWFQAAIFIGATGLTIHTIDKQNPSAHLLLSVSGFVLIWATIIYYRRNVKISMGEMNELYDFDGPAILVSIILFVFSYSVYDGGHTIN